MAAAESLKPSFTQSFSLSVVLMSHTFADNWRRRDLRDYLIGRTQP